MAHSKQAEKRIRQNEKARIRNKAQSSKAKTLVKRVLNAAEDGDVSTAEASIAEAFQAVDKAAKNRVLHPKTAARRKSRLQRELNKARAKKA
ncbi:MAG: 30S ribosomal protein S20 [Planctomycetes bacterium]|nr:30S ribosomal protein S20 [Planctomycetota bacterium]